jgi:hypothetical protein
MDVYGDGNDKCTGTRIQKKINSPDDLNSSTMAEMHVNVCYKTVM